MSDYGYRGSGNGPDEYGWPESGSRREGRGHQESEYGHGRSYHDHGADSYSRHDEPRSGRASVRGSASVGSASSDYSSYSDHDEPRTGRARVPGPGSTGPARGTARVGGKRRSGRALSDEEAEAMRKAKKKKKRRRVLIALTCVLVMMLGAGTVVGSLFFESVPTPDDIDFEQNATILYADGTEMATVGNFNRQVVPSEEIPRFVKDALVSAEDRTFYTHPGVDFWGVMRALWNNVTGGDTQGASTLTQQYVGMIADIRDEQSYFRKAREAVMAMKISDTKTKDEIITDYLNLMPFGRQTYGIAAAADAFFDKKLDEIDVSEAALLIAQLKATGGLYDPADPLGLGEEYVMEEATNRWNYVLNSMVETGKLDKAERDQYTELPEVQEIKVLGGSKGADKPTGFISHDYALQEASEILGIDIDQIGLRGYTIQTTIDPKLQKAAKWAAENNPKAENNYISTLQGENPAAAIVAVDPKTGGIVAYYGGPDGTGIDKAGQEAMHPPGSSFKEFTMIAALEAGMAIESLWDGTSPRDFPERGQAGPVRNSGDQSEEQISMKDSIIKSLNTPIYAMTNQVGAATVARIAGKMGITEMMVPNPDDRDGPHIAVNLQTDERIIDPSFGPREIVDNEIGFGQYPVSVHDMAVANATLAAEGLYHKPHFVQKITDKAGEVVYDAETDPELKGDQVIKREVAKDAIYVSSFVHPNIEQDGILNNGQAFAGKSGTWERHCPDNPGCNQNSSVWYAGFTPQLSAAVWVGDDKGENNVVLDEWGSNAYGSGPAGTVWSRFMNRAMDALNLETQPLPAAANYGDPHAGELGKGKPKDDEEKRCRPNDDRPECRDNNEECRPHDPRPECSPGIPQCIPGQPNFPDCNGDGFCDLDPADPLCGEVPPPPGDGNDGPGTNQGPEERRSPTDREQPPLTVDGAMAFREHYRLIA